MPPNVIDACRLRLERADQHLAYLNSEVAAFIATVRGSIRGHFHPESSQYVFSLSGEPPSEWGVFVGEWAHELRAVLDNLIASCVEKRGGTVTKVTGYIIADHFNRWNGGYGQNLKGLLKSDRALVKNRQPYLRGNLALDHPLSRLQWINNTDKHRLLHPSDVASAAAEFPAPEVMPGIPVVDEPLGAQILAFRFRNPILSKDGTEFCWVTLANAGPDPKMHMDRDPPISVSLTGSERPLVPDDLLEIRREVGEVLAEFEPILK